jgi:hypothetical protein
MPVSDDLLEQADASVLDLLDRLLDKGVMATGDLTLGVAGIDLIYVRLSALVCATDRLQGTRTRVPRQRAARTALRAKRSR